jgi:hypothetical protein
MIDTKTTTQFFLNEPMVNWCLVEQLKPEALGDMVRELDGLIERAARLRGYVDMRYGHGCGDQGHESAVKESNKLAGKIRKSLGFTFARQDVNF